MKKVTKDIFIQKAKEIHGDKYDYSKVDYHKMSEPVCIICPEHGEFWQTPYAHITKKCNCPKCSGTYNYTTDEWIEKAKKIHRDTYDYSKVEYKRRDLKVCIICPEHGEFWQRAADHLNGQGCPKCAGKHISLKKRANKDDIIKRFKEVHGDKFDYSKVEYVNMYKKVCIICPEHGEFWVTPTNHIKGRGCPKCAHRGLNTEEWIDLFKTIHKDTYDYSKVEYKSSQTPICIICPKHGEFWQKPVDHMSGKGCPMCNSSKLELTVKDFLDTNNIKYLHQYSFDWLRCEHPLKLDFYLPDFNIAIECQGEQHFFPNNFFGGIDGYEKTYNRDILKLSLCKEHNIQILYYIGNDVKVPKKWKEYKVIRKLDVLLKRIYDNKRQDKHR